MLMSSRSFMSGESLFESVILPRGKNYHSTSFLVPHLLHCKRPQGGAAEDRLGAAILWGPKLLVNVSQYLHTGVDLRPRGGAG